MKKYICTALALLMAASLFVGCGCTNRNVSDHPGGKITEPTTIVPTTNPMPTMTTPPNETTRATEETRHETTAPTHGATEHTVVPDHTGATGATGSITDSTGSTTHSDNSRSASRWPDRRS